MQRVGFWWAEKKEKDVPSEILREHLAAHNMQLVKLDINRSFEEQGPFTVIVHKLCDMLVKEIRGDKQAKDICRRFEKYCEDNPGMRVIDPLASVRLILDRHTQYQLIKKALDELHDDVSVPPFVKLESSDFAVNLQLVKDHNLRFPLLCKQIVAHGSREAHTMFLILNENGLRKLEMIPCVVQQFVSHSSILYKVFIVGTKISLIKRPSLKEPPDCKLQDLIEFNSHDISKPNAKSPLTDKEAWLRPDEQVDTIISSDRFCRAVKAVVTATRHSLCGIDIIVEKDTQRMFVIDLNNFPGYLGMEDFIPELTNLIVTEATNSPIAMTNGTH